MSEVSHADFYRGKAVQSTEWWVSDCEFPRFVWARLRVFNDGTADACWEDGGKTYGFEKAEFARYFLAEDEYRCFDGLDDEDENEHGFRLDSAQMPTWCDHYDSGFEYLGIY